jgi:3alpha(or 20beta)-hydroxysteroid dehydrogenase
MKASEMSSLQGKVAIITGAAQGLGLSHARLMVRHGARVVVADVQSERGERAAASLVADGAEAVFHRLDVTSPADWLAPSRRRARPGAGSTSW